MDFSAKNTTSVGKALPVGAMLLVGFQNKLPLVPTRSMFFLMPYLQVKKKGIGESTANDTLQNYLSADPNHRITPNTGSLQAISGENNDLS